MLAQPGLGAACVGLKRGMGGSQLVGSLGEQVFEDMLPHPTDLPSATLCLGRLILASPKTEVSTDMQVHVWPAPILNKVTLPATREL